MNCQPFEFSNRTCHAEYRCYCFYDRGDTTVSCSSRLHSARQRLDADALDRDEKAFIEKMEALEA